MSNDWTLPAEGAQTANFCSRGPKFCSIKITQEVSDFAARLQHRVATSNAVESMVEMSGKLRDEEGRIYLLTG